MRKLGTGFVALACSAGAPTQQRQLKEMRSVLNDAHKHILAVSKGLQKPAL